MNKISRGESVRVHNTEVDIEVSSRHLCGYGRGKSKVLGSLTAVVTIWKSNRCWTRLLESCLPTWVRKNLSLLAADVTCSDSCCNSVLEVGYIHADRALRMFGPW